MKPEYCFVAPAPNLQEEPGRKTRSFSGIANSGAFVNRGVYGRMAIDLESASLLPKTPVLLDHDPSQRVGHAVLRYADGALHVSGTLLSNERAKALAADSDDGFPWQMSIYADPESVQDIPAGKSFTLNGKQETGPFTVLLRPLIREISFTPMGADHRTPVEILTHHQEPNNVATDNEAVARLTAQVDDLTAKLSAATAALSEATAALESEKSGRAEALAALNAERDAARKADVVATFTAMGRQDVDAAPYLALSADAWAAVKKDLTAFTARGSNDYLFHDVANGGTDPQKAQADLITKMASA